MSTIPTARRRTGALLLGLALATSACGGDGGSAGGDGGDRGDTAYPLTVVNCDVDVVIEAAPQRIALLNSAPTTRLDAVGALDRVITRAGAFPTEYFDDDVNAFIADTPTIGGDELDASGHFQISVESILATEPDLVLGLPDGITREALADAGIPVLIEPGRCPEIPVPDFDTILEAIEVYGEVFDAQDTAATAITDLQARIDELQTAGSALPERTVAVLFPTIGGGAGYAYGNLSMAHPQVEAAQLTNVFGEVQERVFEVTLEEVLDRDPDVLILLYVDGDPELVEAEIRNLPGADGLTAVQNDAIHVQLFNFTDPPTPLVVDGLEQIIAFLTDLG